MNKKKIVTVLIVIATVILAGVAVFTAIRLYQLREEAVAPTAPTSEPAAQVTEEEDTTETEVTAEDECTLSFTVAAQEAPSCYETCTTSPDNCPTGLECQTVDAQTVCVDPDCPEETDCVCEEVAYSCDSACTTDAQCQEANEDYVCYTITDTCRHQDYLEQEDCQPAATESPTPTDAPTATSTAEAELPEAGVSYPTIISGVMGILLILISLALAL